LLAIATALGLTALADTSGRETFTLGLGGLELVSFERTARGTATTFGPALAVLPLLGGVLNAAGAALLRRGQGRSA
jgi:hypothetical protein